MIQRHLTYKLRALAAQFPVVTLTGPRQSGKTTLCRAIFPELKYVNLEEIDTRRYAQEDPRGFLSECADGAILDEIQRVPDLASYIQVMVDNDDRPGRFVLTGSQQFEVSFSVNQSLAGRTAVLRLLPFSVSELYAQTDNIPSVSELLYAGFYPRIHDKKLNPTDALSAYVSTHVERDIRAISNLKHLDLFERFLVFCAANVGQLINYTRLANDVGVDQETIKSWLSLLKASFICFTLQPHHENFRKRLRKSAKLYFYDVGLACYLLKIRTHEQLRNHPLVGNLFENFAVADLLKEEVHRGQSQDLFFFRDSTGNEVDIVRDCGGKLDAIEVKLGQTLTKSQFQGLEFYQDLAGERIGVKYLIYGGSESRVMYGTKVLPYNAIAHILPPMSPVAEKQ